MLIINFLGLLSSYADEICPYNNDILEYESRIEKLHKQLNMSNLDSLPPETFSSADIEEELNGNTSSQETRKPSIDDENELLRYMLVIFNELPLYCAEKLTGKGVDQWLLMAGFPEITSIRSDSLVEALDQMIILGYHNYFVKNNDRIVDFLYREGIKGGLFQDRWRKVHDFALAAKFSLEEEGSLAEMKAQAARADNPLDFALYLPIWQGAERREQFIQLCQELGCELDKLQECSPEKKEDLWTVKATYIASRGDIMRVKEICNISVENDGILAEFWPISDEDFSNYGLNFRKIGIINSNCAIDEQLNYVNDYGFTEANNCEHISAKMTEK